MSARRKSGLDAVNAGLYVQSEQGRSSYAPRVRDRTQRDLLAVMCNDKVEQARAGNTDAAREILEDFVRSVRRHSKRSWCGPNHYVYARYLADALQRTLDGDDDARIALGIKSSRPGRPKGSVDRDPKALAAAFWLLQRKGYATEECTERIGELTDADRTTVQSAREARYTKAFNRPDLMPDLKLKSIVAKQPYGKALLKLLREAGPPRRKSLPQ